MKRTLIALALLLAASRASAQTATMTVRFRIASALDPAVDHGEAQIDGAVVSSGTVAGGWLQTSCPPPYASFKCLDVPSITLTRAGSHIGQLKVYNILGESASSNAVTFQVPATPGAPAASIILLPQ